jgi:ribosomal protein S18 acetylase RimI-like enzyme
MPDTFTLKRLIGDDLPQYKSLRDTMLALHPEAFTSDVRDEQSKPASSYHARLGPQPGQFTLGAWIGDKLVGAITCERDTRRKVTHIVHLIGMMVLPEARGHGIGRELLRAFIAATTELTDVELVTLSVTATNGPASALYEQAGFKRYGRLPNAIKIGDSYLDKDLMVLEL